jgi:cytochrome c heme-lyase
MTVESEHPFRKGSSCPVDHTKIEPNANGCPVDHSKLNPLTNMPYPEQLQKPTETHDLSNERMKSSIPRSDSSESWTYPSNLMFYNALKRKGFETEPQDVDVMVQVHNFLNESVWEEIKQWENVIGW